MNYSEDLYSKANEVLQESQNEGDAHKEPRAQLHNEKPINSQKKDYRGFILANNISVFDFRSYIFARQMSLLLRLGNSQSARTDLAARLQPRPNASVQQRSVDAGNIGLRTGDPTNNAEDLYSLSELCSRALNFITFAARLLRDDLING
jgi:hypothetical protein